MTRYRKHSLASALALAVSLTACGGSGGNLASAPPVAVAPAPVPTPSPSPSPSPSPTPPPPPTPAGTVGGAAPPQVPNAALFPQATVGGPTLETHDTTQFPLLETVMKVEGSAATADPQTIAGGASITTGGTQNSFSFFVASLGLMLPLSTSFYYSGLFGGIGATRVAMYLADSAKTKLSWTAYGDWAVYEGEGGPNRYGSFVTGYKTPHAAIPRTGTASFSGSVTGQVLYPQSGEPNGIGRRSLSGDAAIQADFGNGSIAGNLTNMRSGSEPWNSVSLQGTISSGSNAFSGTSAATSAPGGFALGGAATGTFAGQFFGPSAQELGAVWTLFDGTRTAQGSFGAKAGP